MVEYDVLNINLKKVEHIIGSKYDFCFHNKNIDEITSTDIMINIIQARVISEGLCRFIVLKERLVKDEKNIRTATLKVYIDDLLRPSLIIPKPIITNISTIQGIGNLAAHFQVDGNLDYKEMIICLESLEYLLEWFTNKYSDEDISANKIKIATDSLNRSGVVPPKAEGCIISRATEVADLRCNLLSEKTVMIKGEAGVGKTELLKDYVSKYKKQYDGVYYAENVEDINDYIYDLPIGIIDEDKKNKEEIIREKLDIVHSMGLKYLFIIDNFTGQNESIKCILPNSEDSYHLLVIVSDEYKISDKIKCYEIDRFSEDDSAKIFYYFCKLPYETEIIQELLKSIYFNPRAIKMCAIFLNENEKYNIGDLIENMKKNSSIKGVMKNLYIVLTELSVLERDDNVKSIASCLSLIPYNGVLVKRFKELLYACIGNSEGNAVIDDVIDKFESSGWISLDDLGTISINPLLSDTIFEKTKPDMTSKRIVDFITPILNPVREIRELLISQVISMEPFVNHLTKRIECCEKCDLNILNDIREYYIATYDIQKIDILTEIMEREFSKYNKIKSDTIENAIYREGISRFNLEDYNEAHKHFSRALKLLDEKKNNLAKDIAKISAYEATSLAALGQKEEAIKNAKQSINIRKELASQGDIISKESLWISVYNYSKVLFELNMCEDAYEQIEKAIVMYTKYHEEQYKNCTSVNVSSLLQLKGRILAGLGRNNEAIELLERAKNIRIKLKGEYYFSTAQIYSYLMDVYCKCKNYKIALYYAEMYNSVLDTQYKTEDIRKKIDSVKKCISYCKERLNDESNQI